jgi:hypothetical protein
MDQFADDQGAWIFAHPEEAQKLQATLRGVEKPEAVAEVAPEVKPAEPEKPAEVKPEVAAATPAAIEEWTTKSPALKAALDEAPELREAIMGMARENEAAKPILEVSGTVEEATFNRDHANRLVTLQTNWMLSAEDPEMVGTAWDQTVEMFKERDGEGKEILENGKPKLGADFKPFVHRAATAAMEDFNSGVGQQIADLKSRLAGNYPNDEAREADAELLKDAEYQKAAFDFVLEKLKLQDGGATGLPPLPADATPQQKAMQKQLDDRQKALDAKEGKQTVESRKAARAQLNSAIDGVWSQTINTTIENRINAMTERGEYIPAFVLTDKWINPRTGETTKLSSFGVYCWQTLRQIIKNNPTHQAKLASLEALGAAGKDARIAELNALAARYLPKLIDKRVSEIQKGIKDSAGKKPATAAGVARVEPKSQSTVMPQATDEAQVLAWAGKEAEKAVGYSGMTPREREELRMEIYSRKMYGG